MNNPKIPRANLSGETTDTAPGGERLPGYTWERVR